MILYIGSAVGSVEEKKSQDQTLDQKQAVATVSWPSRLVGHGGPIRSVRISQDGQYALTASFDYTIIYWKLVGNEGQIIHRFIGHEAAVNDVTFVPNSTRAVSVGDDGKFIVWDLQTGKMVKRFDHKPDKVLSLDVSTDGQFAASARWDQTSRIYNLNTLTEEHSLEKHRGAVNDVAFSHDGKTLYTASYDGVVREWEVETGQFVRPIYNHGWGINVIKALSGSSYLAFGTLDGTMAILDVKRGKIQKTLKTLDRPILSFSQSYDGKSIGFGVGDGSIHVFKKNETDDSWQELEVQKNPTGPVWGLSLVPDGRLVYHAGLDDYAIAWQVVPRKSYETVEGKFIRRFQYSDIKDPGERQFKRKCSVCHTLTQDGANRAGPTLYKVFGRKAGTLPGYTYSQSLLDSDIVWNKETIKALFSDGPDVVTPGSKMPIQKLKNLEHLDALIAYLEKATKPKTKKPKGEPIQ